MNGTPAATLQSIVCGCLGWELCAGVASVANCVKMKMPKEIRTKQVNEVHALLPKLRLRLMSPLNSRCVEYALNWIQCATSSPYRIAFKT